MRSRLLIGIFALCLGAASASAATPPPQPRSGPGSLENASAEVVKRAVGRASAATYVYHLAGDAAEPRPVVVLLHAWGAVNPSAYGGWIDHLARRGFLVLAPAFQEIGRTRPVEASGRAAQLVADALAALVPDNAARPDLARVVYLGHSAGAGVAVNLAASAARDGLPVPKLVFAVMPGGIASDEKARGIQLDDLSKIDPATAIVAMSGDREFQASDRAGRRILREAVEVPASRKLFMRAASDDHGFPALSATLASPGSPLEAYDSAQVKLQPDPPVDPRAPRIQRPRWSPDMVLSGEQTILVSQLTRNVTDALDHLAYWRTFDMAVDAAFAGGDLAALRANPAFVDMLRWSDGWPVRRLSAETPRVEAVRTTPVSQPVAPVARTVSAKQPVTGRNSRLR